MRTQATTGERPIERFKPDEKALLGLLAAKPYHRVGIGSAAKPAKSSNSPGLRVIEVEPRPLSVHIGFAEGAL